MKKQMTELEADDFLHIASTGHLASSSVSGASLQYALTRLSMLTAKSHRFVPGGKQHNGHIIVRGKARDGMTATSSGTAQKVCSRLVVSQKRGLSIQR